MTRDDILKMAREAGVRLAGASDTVDPRNVYAHELERFAALVAAHEREQCVKVCEGIDAAEYEGEDVLATWCAAASFTAV